MKSIKKNAFLSMTLNIVKLLIPLFIGPYLAYTLSIDAYAEYNKAIALLSWFVPIAGFGIYNYGMRNISAYRDNKEKRNQEFSNLFFFGIVSSSIVSIVYFIYIIMLYMNDSHLFLLYFSLMLQIMSSVFNVEFINEADEDYLFITVKTIIVKIIYVITIIIFIKSSNDSVLLAFLTSFNVILNNIISYIYVKRKIMFTKVSLKSLCNYLRPLFTMLLLINVNLFYTSLDKLMLSYLNSSMIEITYYTMSQQINTVITNIFFAIISVTIPRLSYYLSSHDNENYEKLRNTSFHHFMQVVIPACFGLSLLSDCLIFLYGGSKYIGASSTMLIFSLRTIVSVIVLCLANQIIFLKRKEKVLTKLYFISGSLNLIFNFTCYFFKIFNASTVIMTTMISELILVYLQCWYIRNKINHKFRLLTKNLCIYFIASVSFVVINFIIRYKFNLFYALNLQFFSFIAINIFFCSLCYLMFLYVFKENYFMIIVNKARKGIKLWIKKM